MNRHPRQPASGAGNVSRASKTAPAVSAVRPPARAGWLGIIVGLTALLGWLALRADLVTLAWDYPTNELAGVTFRVRWSNDLTATNWIVLATTTNTTAQFNVPRGVNFFTATASNFWGESAFSNVAATPPTVRTNVSLTVTRP